MTQNSHTGLYEEHFNVGLYAREPGDPPPNGGEIPPDDDEPIEDDSLTEGDPPPNGGTGDPPPNGG
jgi:hypothetical protein